MPRILLLIILIWLLYHVLKRFIASASQSAAKAQSKPDEKIVQCTQCGLRVPESESVIQNELLVCNNAQCSALANTKK